MKRKRTDDGASCSSSANPQGYGYEVFLSFRGSDTRKGFTDYLYTSLTNAGIRTFRDNEELRVGEEIGGKLLEAITQSKIFIPIFSKNYASSKWCLKEAAHMVRCKNSRNHLVLPVFYDVTPGQVRHQSGTYEEALKRHSEGPDKKTVPEWRNALAEIGSMKGWEVQNVADGHEGELVNIVVSKVRRELKKAHLVVEDSIIKLEDGVEEVMGMLQIGRSDVRVIVGIYGIGGIGKTTLAKIIYNQLFEHFEYSSFLEGISAKGLEKLQTQLVNDILRSKDLQPEFANVDEGIKVLSEKVKDKRVLILLDDVDNMKKIKALAGDLKWFGGGSRIIITTRDKDVLDVSKVKETYEVRPMHFDEALHLFNMHAFKEELQAADYMGLSQKIVATAAGLPLALEVIGSYLSTKKSKEIWEDTLEKLEKCPFKDVHDKLMISYNALEYEQQQIFLDIACFFIGTDKRIATYMWKDCRFRPAVGVDTLLQRSLIKIGDDDKFRMHDQLRDLGRAIVRNEDPGKPGKRSRLWSIEDVRCVLENQEATEVIEAIQFDCGIELEDCPFTREQPMNLPNVRFLRLDHDKFSSRIQCCDQLSWLQWHGAVMECSLSIGNLVILDLSRSNVTNDWSGWNSKQLGFKLKVLILECCNNLLKTPDLSKFQKLERLSFEGCGRLCEVGPSIGKLKKLIFLNLRYCYCLKELPKELNNLQALAALYIDGYRGTLPNLGGLKKLELLSAKKCKQLNDISSFIGHLTCLSELCLDESGVCALPQLPTSLQCLSVTCQPIKTFPDLSIHTNLLELKLVDCIALERIPGLGNLVFLKILTVSQCQNLTELHGLEGLECLTELIISDCNSLRKLFDLPKSKRLKLLILTSCISLRSIPNLSACTMLTHLSFLGCEKLHMIEGLGELESLKFLNMSDCKAIENLPNLSKLVSLKELILEECEKLRMVEAFGELTSLQFLNMKGCKAIENLPNLSKLVSLKQLILEECENLRMVEAFGELTSLESLEMKGCKAIENLSNLSKLVSHKELFLEECEKLRMVEAFGELTSLKFLDMEGCKAIENLPNLSKLVSLEVLILDECEKLRMVEAFGELTSLQSLFMKGCKTIENLPNLSKLVSLKELSLKECEKLRMVEAFEELTSLQFLYMKGCKAIENLPNLSKLVSLKQLILEECEKLRMVEAFGELTSLEFLDMKGCKAIENLPNLSKLVSLQVLILEECEKLRMVEGLGELESLQELNMKGCKAIENLPNLSKLVSLEELVLEKCEKLCMVEAFGELTSLQSLNMKGCKAIENLPNLSKLVSLKELILVDCKKLKEVHGLEELMFLQRVDISYCPSLYPYIDEQRNIPWAPLPRYLTLSRYKFILNNMLILIYPNE